MKVSTDPSKMLFNLMMKGSAKSRNGTNWGARQVGKSFETDFTSFPTTTQ